MTTDQNTDQPTSSSRPDPVFKLLTRLEAEQYGLQAIETELQYSTRADLILAVPPGLSLADTMFDFFRAVNVIEFKSQNDKFDLREYARNALRTYLQFLQGKDQGFENILNLIISSRQPRTFLRYAEQHGVIFKQEPSKPWLWRKQGGFQEVIILVCRALPLEQRYYPWLAFAPSNTRKWQNYLVNLFLQGNEPLLEVIRQIRPKEYAEMNQQMQEKLKEALHNPEFLKEIHQPIEVDQTLSAQLLLEAIAEDHPEDLSEVLGVLEPEERLSGLKPEERLSGLKPEEREALLKLLTEQVKENPNN